MGQNDPTEIDLAFASVYGVSWYCVVHVFVPTKDFEIRWSLIERWLHENSPRQTRHKTSRIYPITPCMPFHPYKQPSSADMFSQLEIQSPNCHMRCDFDWKSFNDRF